MSAFNMIIIKNYFQGIPMELEEAAIIDGSNDLITFVRIILPLSAPVLASVSLFYAVSHWNSYFNAMLYINNSDMEVITIVLRRLVFLTTQVAEDSTFDWGAAVCRPSRLSRWPPRCCLPCRFSASIRLCRSSLPKVSWSARSRADTKQYNHFYTKRRKTKMKKALSLSMALAMSAAMLAGCGGSASDSTSASQRCFLCGQRCLRHPHRQLYDPRLHRPCAEQ